MTPDKPILCIQLEGVLYQPRHTAALPVGTADDTPIAGAFDWLAALVRSDQFKIVIASAHAAQIFGPTSLRNWMRAHGFPQELLSSVSFPRHLPRAFVTIDDRSLRFDGHFPTAEQILAFKPWYLREAAGTDGAPDESIHLHAGAGQLPMLNLLNHALCEAVKKLGGELTFSRLTNPVGGAAMHVDDETGDVTIKSMTIDEARAMRERQQQGLSS